MRVGRAAMRSRSAAMVERAMHLLIVRRAAVVTLADQAVHVADVANAREEQIDRGQPAALRIEERLRDHRAGEPFDGDDLPPVIAVDDLIDPELRQPQHGVVRVVHHIENLERLVAARAGCCGSGRRSDRCSASCRRTAEAVRRSPCRLSHASPAGWREPPHAVGSRHTIGVPQRMRVRVLVQSSQLMVWY